MSISREHLFNQMALERMKFEAVHKRLVELTNMAVSAGLYQPEGVEQLPFGLEADDRIDPIYDSMFAILEATGHNFDEKPYTDAASPVGLEFLINSKADDIYDHFKDLAKIAKVDPDEFCNDQEMYISVPNDLVSNLVDLTGTVPVDLWVSRDAAACLLKTREVTPEVEAAVAMWVEKENINPESIEMVHPREEYDSLHYCPIIDDRAEASIIRFFYNKP